MPPSTPAALPSWIKSASNNWIANRTVWSSVLYSHASSKAMTRKELTKFSLIQKWLNENAIECKDNFREALLLSSQQKENNKLAEEFEKQIDWSQNPRVLLYGSSIQGTAQKGGDADFALCFPPLLVNQQEQQNQLIEPPRLLQRSIILPTFFKQLGETFPPIEGLTGTQPQPLHVDRVYHARVPILHFVPKHTILPKLNPSNAKKFVEAETGVDHSLPRFDVAACSSGCKNSHVLRFYFKQSHILRILFLALKRWARHRAYVIHSKRSSLNSYSLAIMLIYWAQERQQHVLLNKNGILQTEEDPSWCDLNSSPLVHGETSFLGLLNDDAVDKDDQNFHEHHQKFIDLDNQKQPDECIASLLFDFFLFYAEIFDRDTQVVDIRGSQEIGKVLTRAEWKDKVNEQFANRDLRVFGLETDQDGKPVLSNHNKKKNNYHQEQTSSKMMNLSESEQRQKEFEIVTRHLYGHDVVAVRDPVEPHSVTRNLDFFMCEALWEEFKLAVNCSDPTQLLGL